MNSTNRKSLVWLISTFLVTTAIPVANAQQPKKPVLIGFLSGPTLASFQSKSRIDAFRQSLRDLNYIEGQNISFEWRSANGVEERLPSLAAELVQLKVDLICTQGTPATRLQKVQPKRFLS